MKGSPWEVIRLFAFAPFESINPIWILHSNGTTSTGTGDFVDYVDMVLVMSVNPGFGGQSFIPSSIEKIKKLKDLIGRRGLTGVELEVDGGINENTAASVVNAGSGVLVAGSAIYGHPEGVAEAIRRLRLAASGETA